MEEIKRLKILTIKGDPMYCESCGKQIPDDSRFCEFCGSPVKAEAYEDLDEEAGKGTRKEADIASDKKVDRAIRNAADSGYSTHKKPRARLRLLPLVLVLMIGAGGYMAVKELGGISGISGLILGKGNADSEITRDDFSWYEAASYDEVPQGGTSLDYRDILGEWKVMAVNYVSEPEETFFSTAVLKENSSLSDEGKALDTAVEFTHHYVEFDGEKSEFEGDEASDLLYADFEEGYLSMALGDDRMAEIIFWKKDGKEYGQSHIYSDWDRDGIADLVNVILFSR